jgi:surface antigen
VGSPLKRHGVTLAALSVAGVVAAGALVPSVAGATPVGDGAGRVVLCDRADYGCVEGTGYHGQSVWGANYGKTGHNCTSYVSYLLAQQGTPEPWHTMGNANRWDDNGRGKVPVDDVPAVGAVAQWEGGSRYAPGSSGHVAFVEAVTASGIEISEDNHSGGTRRVRLQRGSAYWPSHFVHIDDLGPPSQLTDAYFALAASRHEPADSLRELTFGTPGDIPVVGDWNGDGKDTLGVFHDGQWALSNGRTGTKLRTKQVAFGTPGDTPVVGDWNGDGKDDVGVFRDGLWTLAAPTKANPNHALQLYFGAAGDTPVAGNWDGVDGDTVGVFHNGNWALTNDLYGGLARRTQLSFGTPGDRPVAGNWDGVRGDSIGVYRDGQWTLSNTNTATPKKVVHVALGDESASPLVGNWDGKATDSLGISR